MKSHWIISFLLACALAIFANAQENSGGQTAEGPIANLARQNSGGAASPAIQLQAPAGLQDAGSYPERLEQVLGAMSAELGEIAQAAREGKISRDQAEYLSLERYYVALTRFQFLRTLYQDPPQDSQAESYAQSNPAPQIPNASVILPPQTCSPDISEQLVSYLELTPRQVEEIRAQVTAQCEQVQPLMERLEESRRKEISIKLSGKFDVKEVQALAAEQSGIIKQLIVANSQLEIKLYSMLTSEQQRKVDGVLRQSLDSEVKPAFADR
ncbi:MAG: Spy/CpxP family protein refolding chaperone [Candidatus Korobacteraceae bacterium]